jgi:hypothetical protein
MPETARNNVLILHRGKKTDILEEIEAFYTEINRFLATAPEDQEEPVSPYLINIFNEAVKKISEQDSYCQKYLVPDSVQLYWPELVLAGRALQGYIKEKYR